VRFRAAYQQALGQPARIERRTAAVAREVLLQRPLSLSATTTPIPTCCNTREKVLMDEDPAIEQQLRVQLMRHVDAWAMQPQRRSFDASRRERRPPATVPNSDPTVETGSA
jgi:hypothetical protein